MVGADAVSLLDHINQHELRVKDTRGYNMRARLRTAKPPPLEPLPVDAYQQQCKDSGRRGGINRAKQTNQKPGAIDATNPTVN